ncbi:5-dehydro-2-deoxygluconokinase [Octadecabacter sp. 1_MG-2023]|uniref:5-dehydro-2-deoxygluconokinase n=1 Tax=unclassified Octadecabacter TaxID=196158 RepID=UPI001C0A3B1D|nr:MULTISPECIES: 5-dehydro-2-deoxygluconokinase [unclassified Octadecabacter]MBU2994590.1 5-dehydro-2-deoxygluconokinase [Octadecabacter sp. B2R22]MDO6734117.1 5-dehydro-2-deoxygluconokinase [Octadecabacter sp. 1_MG-2023]
MSSLLKGIKANNFVIVGRAGMDFFTPAGTATEDAETFHAGLGGSSANTAAGICKLGGKATIVTRVSDDSIGRYCVNQLKRYGVGTDYVTPVGGEFRNSLAVYESRLEGHQSVIYRNGAADFEMNNADVEAVDYARFGALITAGTVLAAEPSRSATFRAFDLAKKAGLPIIFDVDYRPYSWPSAEVAADVLSRAADQCDMIVGNDEEFGFMAGSIDKGLEKARELSQSTAAIVVYKMGPEGAITFAEGQEIHTGIYPVEALKPTGAGDSFMAGLLTSLADGHDLKTSLLRGSACASVTVSRPGCAPAMANTKTLETFLATHPGPTQR